MPSTDTELPPPRTEPLDTPDGTLARLGRRDRRAAGPLFGAEPVFLLLRTRSRVDIGGWLGRRRVWVAALRAELALFAGGRRPYAERVGFDRLGGTRYNHVTGELVLAPADGLRVRRLRVTPLDGYQILAQIHS